MKTSDFLTLGERLFPFGINVLLAFVVFHWSTGLLLPTGNLESVWFLSAVSLWTVSLISQPWFSPPRDILLNALAALLVLITMDLSAVPSFKSELQLLLVCSAVYCVAVLLFSLAALIFYERNSGPKGKLFYKIATTFGRPDILFTAPALIGALGAFQGSLPVLLWLLVLWMVIVVAQPVERLILAWKVYKQEQKLDPNRFTVGSVERIDHPNLVRVRLAPSSKWVNNSLYVASLPDGSEVYVLSLFSQTQGGEIVGTGLCVGRLQSPIGLHSSGVQISHEQAKVRALLSEISGREDARIIGFVVENSNIGEIRFEVATTVPLEEGDVLFVRVNRQDIYYQVTFAETHEETFDNNPRGTQIVQASQLGCFSEHTGFTKFTWLPEMNSPVFSVQGSSFKNPETQKGVICIGNVPRTNIDVLATVDDLVGYHSAILGVTGTGKTELALSLIEKCLGEGVKVFCVDFTGEYRERLKHWKPQCPSLDGGKGDALHKLMQAVEFGEYGAKKEREKLDQGIAEVTDIARKDVAKFLTDSVNLLTVLELSEITNSKLTLRLTELYLSLVMKWAQQNRKAQRILLCLEEAHTIIPEPYNSGFDADTKWVVERIGQIALQGRKYGVGLMVITQRTALVSKTILSQCNTFFTHALIDQTSLNFLESVYSSRHVRQIPNLAKFHFLAFGKAVKCERPIVVQRPFDEAVKAASEALDKKIVQDLAAASPSVDHVDNEAVGPRVRFP